MRQTFIPFRKERHTLGEGLVEANEILLVTGSSIGETQPECEGDWWWFLFRLRQYVCWKAPSKVILYFSCSLCLRGYAIYENITKTIFTMLFGSRTIKSRYSPSCCSCTPRKYSGKT